MPNIRKLPVGLVNKIAAGEVIERPASVIKELLENSIDAGADTIEVSVEGGGIELIRISDNGCGVEHDQLELALDPHATSKLQTSDDLFDVHTLGFRGEALASIAEISHLSFRSRTADSDSGYELRCNGGEREPIRPCPMGVGTTVEIRNLFFNTPVRRKFMKSASTEIGHVTDAFARIALAFPNVRMTLRSNDRVVHDLPPTPRWADRIRAFYGDEIADALIAVKHNDEHVNLRGYVTDPSVSRANNRFQFLFLNGRYIRDRALQHALGEAYRGLLIVGRMPICFLHIEIDPKVVDVNVHPTKVEVRFADSGAIYSRILHTLRHQFLSSNLVAKVGGDPSLAEAPMPMSVLTPIERSVHIGSGDELMAWARQQSPATLSDHSSPVATLAPPYPGMGRGIPDFQPYPEPGRLSTDPLRLTPVPNPAPAIRPTQDTISGHARSEGFQIHDRYLITQDEAGMVIIDQHALHERIMYEQIKTKVLSKSLEKQRLLVPETVTLTASERGIAMDAKDMLAEIGIDIEPFGGDTLLVTAYPSILTKMSPAEMLRSILEALISGGKKINARDILDDLMNMMACKAAIKAGDRLSSEEISALLEQRHCYQDTHHCPHGRPTALFFSREQLDKMFKRT